MLAIIAKNRVRFGNVLGYALLESGSNIGLKGPVGIRFFVIVKILTHTSSSWMVVIWHLK